MDNQSNRSHGDFDSCSESDQSSEDLVETFKHKRNKRNTRTDDKILIIFE